jgi:hypothetical protein
MEGRGLRYRGEELYMLEALRPIHQPRLFPGLIDDNDNVGGEKRYRERNSTHKLTTKDGCKHNHSIHTIPPIYLGNTTFSILKRLSNNTINVKLNS